MKNFEVCNFFCIFAPKIRKKAMASFNNEMKMISSNNMKQKQISIIVLLLLILVGCGNTQSNSNVTQNQDTVEQKIDSLSFKINFKHKDSIFNKLVLDSIITDKEAYLIKEVICPKICQRYDFSDTYDLTYRDAIAISHSLEQRIDSLKQYDKSISFPFQLGQTITVPQIIAFGKRKDVRMKPQTRDVYTPDYTQAGNRKTFAYTEHLPSHLERLEEMYKGSRKKFYYYAKDSNFTYKYENFTSFDFSRNGVDYSTSIHFYGNRLMWWGLTYRDDIKSLYIEKYGEPLFTNADTSFLCWDFKNIRIEVETYPDSWSSEQFICFINKEVCQEKITHSKLVEKREIEAERKAEKAAKEKAYRDSLQLAKKQRDDL